MAQQQAAAIPAVSGPNRYPGKQGEHGGGKGILQKDGQIKSLGGKLAPKPPHPGQALVPPLLLVEHDPIHLGAGGKDIRHPGVGQDGYLGGGKILPDGPHRRGGHDGVADPVG